jgi:Septum formation initiator
MAGNRKNQAAAIRFGPALKAAFLCLLIAGSAVGYVWQKSQIYQLGQQISQREAKLKHLRSENQTASDQLAILRSPVMLDQRVRELNLGLAPAQPTQVWRLPEPAATPGNENATRQFAARQAGATTQ